MHALLVLSILAAPCPQRGAWPTSSWPVSLTPTKTAKADAIKALEDYMFTLQGNDGDRVGIRTDSLIIIKSGTIIYERYGRGFSEKNRHISWSVAKSVSTALAGVAVLHKALTLEDSICDYVEARQDLCPITVQHLMEFGSGMHWQEGYENAAYQTSSVISMLFGEGHQDMTAFVLREKKEAEPGTVFQYSTGEAGLLSEVVRRAGVKKGLGNDWFWPLFFNAIGMSSAVLQGDPKGAPAGGSYLFATPRDYARFGYLYLNDGCWAGNRVLPEDWVTRSSHMSDTFKNGAPDTENGANGWMWWTNEVVPKTGKRRWPDAPADMYTADGHWGQFVAVMPSLDTVVVRTGDDRDDKALDQNQLFSLAAEVAK